MKKWMTMCILITFFMAGVTFIWTTPVNAADREEEIKALKKRVEELEKSVGGVKSEVTERLPSFERVTKFMEEHKL